MKRRFKPYKSKRSMCSLANFEIRARKDEALSIDVGHFLSSRNASPGQLVEKLLSNSFERNRHADPSYPV